MTTDGYIKIYKKIFKSPIFRPQIMSEREAFIWMICTAAFIKNRGRFGNYLITLERGQLVGGSDYLSDIFMWNPSRVRRYIKRLQKDNMIDCHTDEGITVITIRNYNDYQFAIEQTDNQPTTLRLQTDDNIKNINKHKKDNIYTDDFNNVWEKLTSKVGSKKKAFFSYQKVKHKTTDSVIVEKYNYLLSTRQDPQFWPMFSTWLNQERWEEKIIIGEAYLRKKHNIGKEYKYYNTEGKNHLFIFKDGMMAYKQTFDLEGNKIANEY